MTNYSGVHTAGSVVSIPQSIRDVYSLYIMHEAQAVMRFEDFAVQKTELLAQPGQNIFFTRYNNLNLGGQLQEHVAIVTQNMTAAQQSVTVTEWGNGIGVTEKMLQMSFDDLMAEASVLLGRDYAVVNDLMLRNTIVNAAQIVYAGNKASRAALDGGNDYFDVEVIRQAVEILQTKNAPKFNGEFYVCFLHPHQAAYLKRNPDWVAANNYHQTRRLFNGELGMWEDVVFIATTHMRNGAAASTDPGYEATMVNAATGGAVAANVYESFIFSDMAYAKAIGLPVELRDDGVNDFGRLHKLAWYSIMGAGILEDDFIVKIETV